MANENEYSTTPHIIPVNMWFIQITEWMNLTPFLLLLCKTAHSQGKKEKEKPIRIKGMER